MNAVDLITNLGPVSGVVIVVLLFTRFAHANMKEDRCHRAAISKECHEVQARATEATVKVITVMERTEKALDRVDVTLVRLNGKGP